MKKKIKAAKKQVIPARQKQPANGAFPIVAIGASAGGLEAVSELLKNLSPATGMAYVYIQHLDPTHKSMLSAILSKATEMKVAEAKEKMKIEANHLYIIPPNKDMIVVDGTLRLNPRPAKPAAHMPINQFFSSLAEKRKEGAIGVVLSGNASDGSLGLRAIKIAGGVTFAQDSTAKFQSMPKSAVAEGAVDRVLSPAEIAKELERLSTQSGVLQTTMGDGDEELTVNEDELAGILNLLKKSTGVDFSHYKRNTIQRRIVRRMLLYQIKNLNEYAHYLKQHANEVNTLFQDLLINVTSFFRDEPALGYVKKQVLPKILKSKALNDPVRIWIPACSTGEEAYSIAMILMEVLGDKIANISVQIFATDLSEAAIAKARNGIYSKDDIAGVSPKRLQRFFARSDSAYRIIKPIRDLCIFAPHNIFRDPPFSRLDLISCCNLMIYLDTFLQQKLIATFHYALNNSGYLILGKSESIGTSTHLFTSLDKKLRVYARRKDSNSGSRPNLAHRFGNEGKKDEGQREPGETLKATNHTSDIEKTVDSILLNRYVPPCVVVNDEFEILQFRGATGLFLEPAPGKASLNLLKMARRGLGFELRNLIHKVMKTGKPAKKTGIDAGKVESLLVGIEVVPLKTEQDEKQFLVLFTQEAASPSNTKTVSSARDHRITQLETELLNAREDMRAMLEEHEAVNEELQSANEEIVSSNEELQSINEELETSKEEVESTNEELVTVNQEIQVSNDQLTEAYEYSEAIQNTITESILVLDHHLRIKSVNHSFYKTFHVTQEQTLGYLIYDLGNRQWNIPKLRELLEDIIPSNNQIFGYQVHHNFPEIGEKIMVLNARRLLQKTSNQDLILVVIDDQTLNIKAQEALRESEEKIRTVLEDLPQMAWVTDLKGKITFINNTFREYSGFSQDDFAGKETAGLTHPDDYEKMTPRWKQHLQQGKPFSAEVRYKRASDGMYRWHLVRVVPVKGQNGAVQSWVGTSTDIHEQKTFVEELENRVEDRTHELNEANATLERSNKELEQFAYVASHDLQEPLRKIQTFTRRLIKNVAQNLPEPDKVYLNKINAAAQRMTVLIEELLNYSKITAEKDYKEVDLNRVMQELLIDFEQRIIEKSATVTIGPMPVVPAVEVQMRQLFYNLISNSLKFNDGNTVIHIQSRQHSGKNGSDINGRFTEITVKDNGIGFPQKFAAKAFEMLQRLHDGEKYPGTGIGLALCKKIVENHGGSISIKSKEGDGTEVKVLLPMERNSSSDVKGEM